MSKLNQHRPLLNSPHPSEPGDDFEEKAEGDYVFEYGDRFKSRRIFRKEFPLADPSPATATAGVRPKRGNSSGQLVTGGQESEEEIGSPKPTASRSNSKRDPIQSPGSKDKRNSIGSKDKKKKDKELARERKNKIDALQGKIDAGRIHDDDTSAGTTLQSTLFLDPSASEQSSGPLFSPTMEKIYDPSAALNPNGNGSVDSLIFPTRPVAVGGKQDPEAAKKREIARRLNECEEKAKRFTLLRMRKPTQLDLSNTSMTSEDDIPVKDLFNTPLGNMLQKLLLRKNKLKSIPPRIVQCLPALTVLDLQQCSLHDLPEFWNLPRLKTLDASCNYLTDFPGENMLRGLPELAHLNLSDNKISDITLPSDTKLLSKLQKLDLGHNQIANLPEELDRLVSLHHLVLEHNFFEIVPMRVCLMKTLKVLDVSCNESIHQPPIHDCDRGVCAMRRYWECLRREEESKRAVEENLKRRAPKICHFSKSSSLPATSPVVVKQSEPDLFSERMSSTSTKPVSVASTPKHQTKAPQTERSMSAPIPSIITTPTTPPKSQATINDTLKVIVVGMELAGKTSMIKKLIEGRYADIPEPDKRTVGVDIFDWNPKADKRFQNIECTIETKEHVSSENVDVKFSVWDFAGQHVYHATHELFFSKHALYVIVWDMAVNNKHTYPASPLMMRESGAFSLDDSSDEEGSTSDSKFTSTDANRQADLALVADIDEKVQFWVDCIQNTCPGAVILPVASFADSLTPAEAIRRCNIMKERLLRHEEKRVRGIEKRLEDLKQNYCANDVAANRLKFLLCTSNRPKFAVGSRDDSVVKVSCTDYLGFDKLTARIVSVATGKETFDAKQGFFVGHVGALIPRLRLDVRKTVRAMRKKFRVVEWGYFTGVLREQGLTSAEDIVDALLFLSSTGELSFFGGAPFIKTDEDSSAARNISDVDEWTLLEYDGDTTLSQDTTTISTRTTSGGSSTTFEELFPTVSQFVFLNPRWLVAAVACVLRHDLDIQIKERRRDAAQGLITPVPRTAIPGNSHVNCPVITSEDACLLWRHDHTTNKAAERAMQYSNNESVSPFDFLQTLLTKFGVFVPIDLDIEKVLFGGKEYKGLLFSRDPLTELAAVETTENEVASNSNYFLPCLLGPAEPGDAFTYKTSDSWKTTICHSLLFPDGVPTGLMERLTSTVLSVLHTLAKNRGTVMSSQWTEHDGQKTCTFEGLLNVKEILCWQKALYLKIGSQVTQTDGTEKESIVEIFVTLSRPDSSLCVGAQHMVCGMRRLIISSRGPAGNGGKKIWNGGHLLILKCCQRVITEYGGAEYEKQGFCPKCLAESDVKKASYWPLSTIRAAVVDGQDEIHCHYGHVVETRLVAGPHHESLRPSRSVISSADTVVKVDSLLHAVVVVGLWDGRTRQIVRVGSGFIVDKKRGLVVTAAHTLINVWDDRSAPFGEDYYGLGLGRVVIGVIPAEEQNGVAVFRYFAQILAKDPNLDQGSCRIDACVLRIVTRLENDVVGSGENWGDQPETLLSNQISMKSERLPTLKLWRGTNMEREEQVRVMGFNQGGEGLLRPGQALSRVLDFAIGYYVSTYPWAEDGRSDRTERFKPNEEMIVMCPTIGGHSGGPCVNMQGEVIGILSRADSAESQRCYLVPSSELKSLVSRAKKLL